MKILLLTLLLGSFVGSATAQTQVITLLQNGISSFFYGADQLNVALNTAANGDTLILPGGPFSPSGTLSVTKRLVWVGAGYRPDTNMVTTPTVFTSHPLNQIHISQGASGSSFHGIRFDRLVQVAASGSSVVTDVGFTRCQFKTGLRLAGALGNSSTNIQLRQCVFEQGMHIPQGQGISANNAPQQLLLENCIVVGSINFGSTMTTGNVTNCIFLSTDLSSTTRNNGLAYTNCIFAALGGGQTINNPSYFSDCLFADPSGSGPVWGSSSFNIAGNNNSILTANNVFRSVPTWNQHNMNYDYRLAPAPNPALNMGAYDSGVYDGPTGTAWKQGGIPFNPHWVSLSPSLGNTNGGTINVNFTGAAQEN